MRSARSRFWPTVMSKPWAWTLLAVAGIGGPVAGGYFSWGYTRGGTAAVTALSLLGGIVAALILIFLLLLLGTPLAAVHERLDKIEEALPAEGRQAVPDTARVALLAIRTELIACQARIEDALVELRWWRPGPDALPAAERHAHFVGLASPDVLPPLRGHIENAYLTCDSLNRRVDRRVQQHRDSQVIAIGGPPASTFQFQQGDLGVLTQGRDDVRRAVRAITRQVDGGS